MDNSIKEKTLTISCEYQIKTCIAQNQIGIIISVILEEDSAWIRQNNEYLAEIYIHYK